MSTTPHLGITELAENQASPDVTVNEGTGVIDCAIQITVTNMDTTSTPGSPTDGDRYIVGASATGDWASKDEQVACYVGTAWHYLTPQAGWSIYDQDTQTRHRYENSNWVSCGDAINVTAATGGVTAGDVHIGTDIAGVYLDSATGGATVQVALSGVYAVSKVTATGGADFTQLDKVYAVATGGSNEAKNAGTIPLGHSVAAATTTGTTVTVRLGAF